jgi:uncharacterized protein (TIGR03435 family)
MRVFIRISLAVLLTVAAFSQTGTQPAFEASDVHPSSKSGNQNFRGPFTGGGRYELRKATMVDMIVRAYGVDADKVLGGPNWLEYDRFDLLAKMPPNTSAESAKLMLQTLLADRFKLVVRQETQPMPAFALTVGKGKPKLREADGSGETGCKNAIQGLPGPSADGAPVALPASLTVAYTCRNMTMAVFAQRMRGMANDIIGTAPVLDKTDLQGAWDFDFKSSLNLRGLGVGTTGDTITFPDALDKQLGLKLEPIKVPLPVINVESVNNTPTPNLPNVAGVLPATPVEFEVADIRPSAPLDGTARRIGIQFQPSGRVNISGLPLRTLFLQAWGVSNDGLAGAPKFMDSDRYDVIAKAPAGSVPVGPTPIGANGPEFVPFDNDTVWGMMRKLLTERFKITTHMEDRMMTAYDLIAVKPKMKKADPSSRTKWTDLPATGGALGRQVKIQNMTMAQLCEKLQYIAGGYIHSEVLDQTGLEGSYDFTLSFSPAGLVNNPGRGGLVVFAGNGGAAALGGPPAAGGGNDAADPSGGVSLFEAVEKQLGLKLKETKRAAPFLVIDHIEEKPTDN